MQEFSREGMRIRFGKSAGNGNKYERQRERQREQELVHGNGKE